MSKRAEERALQRYALREITPENVKLHDEFQAGYELAEKDLADVAAFSGGPDGFYYGKGYQQGKKDAEKHLGWHSVEESLPPEGEEVIVLRDEHDVAPYYEISFGHIVESPLVVAYCGWNIPGVKYWMSMPKIPEK